MTPDICTEDEVTKLVHTFYSRVRRDDILGPVFESHVGDWPHHLAKLVDFWSAILRGTARYRGTPMPKHAALPGIEPAMFQRWLALFRETTTEIGNAAMKARADAMAARIAQSLWYGYQLHRDPDASPASLVLSPA